MNQRERSEFIEDILAAIIEIEGFVAGVSFEEFSDNREKTLAIVKLLEIIGEATKNIPDELRYQYPHISWKSVTGMRNVLVHEYWQVDEAVVWSTVMESLPLLKTVMIEMIQDPAVLDRWDGSDR
ncbi:MAG: DUF86 domain-containing protein [Spirulinaceae cyanobacterium]